MRLAYLLFAFASLAFAQPQSLTTSAVQTITGQKTFSGSNVLCLKEPSGTDKICFNSPALGSATISLTTPAVTGTLATLADIAAGGFGDVTGPASTTDGRAAVFDGASGNLLKEFVPTAKSVLFAGASGVLAEDNGFFQWDSATHLLHVGPTTANLYPSGANGTAGATQNIHMVRTNASEMNAMTAQSLHAEGYSAIQFADNSGNEHAAIGYGNPSAVGTIFRSAAYFEASTPTGSYPDMKFISTVIDGPVWTLRANFASNGELQFFRSQAGNAESMHMDTTGNIIIAPGASAGVTAASPLTVRGDVTFATTGGTTGFYYDAANVRLNLGTATSTSGNDLSLQKTVNGQVGAFIQNASTGTGGFSVLGPSNSTSNFSLIKTSTGFTTAGLIDAATGLLSNTLGKMLIANDAAQPIIFAVDGTATADEAGRINASRKWSIGANADLITTNLLSVTGASASTDGIRYTQASVGAVWLAVSTNALIGFDTTSLNFKSGVSGATGDTSGGTTRMSLTTGGLTVRPDLAIPAGGTAGAGVMVSSTANFGIFFGSGAPTLSAAKGSLYLRSDGSGTGDRVYVNTNGTTGWAAITTAS